MRGYSIKEAAIKLNISDKALYKRISNEKFNSNYINKIDGKTIITEEGLEYLSGVVKKKRSTIYQSSNEVAIALNSSEKEIANLDDDIIETRIKVYTQNEIDIIFMLKEQVDYLKKQLEKQSINYQEQLRIQAETYQSNLKIQLETIKSKEAIILNMQEIIRSEQDNTKKILDYEERSKEIDEKLYNLRKELVDRKEKNKKGLFSFLK